MMSGLDERLIEGGADRIGARLLPERRRGRERRDRRRDRAHRHRLRGGRLLRHREVAEHLDELARLVERETER